MVSLADDLGTKIRCSVQRGCCANTRCVKDQDGHKENVLGRVLVHGRCTMGLHWNGWGWEAAAAVVIADHKADPIALRLKWLKAV